MAPFVLEVEADGGYGADVGGTGVGISEMVVAPPGLRVVLIAVISSPSCTT